MCGLLFGSDGELKAEFLSRSIKTLYEFGGPAVCGEPVTGFDRIKTYSRSIMEKCGKWFGPAALEYKISARDGIPYLMDINPRFWGYGSMAVKSGINFPDLAVKNSMGHDTGFTGEYRDDIVLLREINDVAIPRKDIKNNGSKKVTCVLGTGALKNVSKLKNALLRDIPGLKWCKNFIITGEKEELEQLSERDTEGFLSLYCKQVSDMMENLQEIAFYNHGDIVVYIKSDLNQDDIDEIRKTAAGLSAGSGGEQDIINGSFEILRAKKIREKHNG
ncbi:MAG: hypothetical protein GF408_00020 [Candidatus Omnitrophica bacterium]|nr:hypothetical protein [Candidatus Omnitrophota bacterium]